MRRWLVVLVVALAACTLGGGPPGSPADATCREWVDELTPPERSDLARVLLSDLWRQAGASLTPAETASEAFADAIGSVCRGSPEQSVTTTASRVIATLPDLAPPGPGSSASAPLPALEAPDDPLVVADDGIDRVELAITEVEGRDSFFGPAADDVAPADRMYLLLHVTYRALSDGVTYGPADWTVTANGIPAAPAEVLNGPEPPLGGGVLRRGEVAAGYLVYDVPITGEVALLYREAGRRDAAAVEVVLREAPREF